MRATMLCSLLATCLVTGCNPDAEYAAAIPKAEEVAINVPSKSGSAALGQAITGQPSEFYAISFAVSSGINLGTAGLLGIVALITVHPSTSQTANSRTWGPSTPGGLDPLTYRLVVTKLATKHFSFSLEARPRASTSDADFLAMFDGEVTEGAVSGTGKGTMSLHFDNRRMLVPTQCENGTVSFVFDDTGSPVTNDVTLADFGNANAANPICGHDAPAQASYHFQQATGGAGMFTFSAHRDAHNLTSDTGAENMDIQSRWQADGAGRADVTISGTQITADLNAAGLTGPVSATQCWSSSFLTVYETSTPPQINILPTDGNASACAF
jgi:hypothetical protein